MTDRRILGTSLHLGLSCKRTEILLHALGFQKCGRIWKKGGWRNYFAAGDSDNAPECAELERGGWMWKTQGGTHVVSAAAIAALKLTGWKFVEGGDL